MKKIFAIVGIFLFCPLVSSQTVPSPYYALIKTTKQTLADGCCSASILKETGNGAYLIAYWDSTENEPTYLTEKDLRVSCDENCEVAPGLEGPFVPFDSEEGLALIRNAATQKQIEQNSEENQVPLVEAQNRFNRTKERIQFAHPGKEDAYNQAFDGNTGQKTDPVPSQNWGFGLIGGRASAAGKTGTIVTLFLERRLPILPPKAGGIYVAANLPLGGTSETAMSPLGLGAALGLKHEVLENTILNRTDELDYTYRTVVRDAPGMRLAPYFDLNYVTPAVLKRLRGEFGLGLSRYSMMQTITKETTMRMSGVERTCYAGAPDAPYGCGVPTGYPPQLPGSAIDWSARILSEKILSQTPGRSGWLGNWHAGLRLALKQIGQDFYGDATPPGLDLIFRFRKHFSSENALKGNIAEGGIALTW